MSSTKTPAVSDKVDVSFATDDEEETSSASEDDTTSSSESEDDVKSDDDDDGDADDESEMPTFTLSLQPSTSTNDADDALPDLSQSQQQTQQQPGASDNSETQIEVTTFQLILSSVSDAASETPPQLLTSAKEEVDDESVEESEECEESEEDAESEEEEKENEEQNLPSASPVTTSTSTSVSTKVDTKEDLTITSSKLLVTETKIHVKEVKEELAATAVVESKISRNADKTTKESASNVKEDENTSTSSTKVDEKSKEEKSLKSETEEKISDVSTTATTVKTTKPATTNDAEATSAPSASNPDSKSHKKKKDSASKEVKTDSSKADMADSNKSSTTFTVANDLKLEDGIKETDEKAAKLSAAETTETIQLATTIREEETKELKAKEQSETVSTKSGKSRKMKVSAKETKQEEKETTEEDKAVSNVVSTQQNTEKFESEEITASKTISIANAETKVNPEKQVTEHDQNISTLQATKVETTNKPKSEELLNKVISQTTEVINVETGVSESAAVTVKNETAIETQSVEGKLSSKKKSKHLAVDTKESEVETVNSPTSVKTLEYNESKAAKSVEISSSVAAPETAESQSAFTVTESGLENEMKDAKSDKDKSFPEAAFNDKIDVTDTKLKGTEDEGKLLAAEDEEFRPRRNSIDDFIKRILAEAREEQKKILDSCAVASSEETTSETSTSASTKVVDGLVSSDRTELDLHKPPMVNGVDASLRTKPARRNLDDLDIDSELADISRYYAKRTLLDRVSTNDDEPTEFGSVTQGENSARSRIVTDGDEGIPPTSNEEMLHFVPQRREATAAMVRESSRPVRVLVDQQTSVIRQLTEASRSIDELDNEIRQLRQSTGGREALYASIGAAIRDEIRIYEMELAAAGERLGQQRLPGGGRFIREQFVAQCATELLQRTAVVNGPRLDRAATLEDWTRVGRRRSGSFSEDLGGSSRTGTRPWNPSSIDRDATDLMIQYRHSRSGSVVSDRGYSSYDAADEPRTSSLLSRLSSFNGSTTSTEPDFGRYTRASSEAPRLSYPRSQPTSDDWPPNSSTYSVARQFVGHVSYDSAEDTNGELDVGYRVAAATSRPVVHVQHIYRRYQPQSVDNITPHSRLYVRRGSLQGYSSYDAGSSTDAGRSFNSRFLSRVREKKALGETTTTAASDRPFRSRFLKPSSVTGSTSTTYSSSRSATQYDSDDN